MYSILIYDKSVGYYAGANLILQYPVSDLLTIFLQSRITLKMFDSEFEHSYYDGGNWLYDLYGTIEFDLLHQITALGIKVKL
jgi:hypothetical protein